MPKKKTQEEFIQEVYNLVKDEYTVLGEYINCHTKILVRHNKCNNEYYVCPNNFLNGKRCPKCSGGIRSNLKEFKIKVYNLVENEYSVLGEYVNCHTKILMKHNICNNEYYVKPNDFQQGYRCPHCRESKGEKIISKYLEEHNIQYKQQVSFPDCKYKLPLKFDFQLYINNNIILLEYDGEQHFKKTFYGEHFKEQQIRDSIKNDYCKSHNIHLYRISYKDFNNIYDILSNIIEKERSTTIENIN